MTFAEIVVAILFGVGVFYLLKPLQKRLELWFYHLFRSKSKNDPGPIIDITNYTKKDKDPNGKV